MSTFQQSVDATLERALELSGYDPSQERDEHGRWTDSGGGDSSESSFVTKDGGSGGGGKKVRWGHVKDIDARTRPGTEAATAAHASTKLRRLHAFRTAHEVASHAEISAHAKSLGYEHSNQLTHAELIKFTEQKEAEHGGPTKAREKRAAEYEAEKKAKSEEKAKGAGKQKNTFARSGVARSVVKNAFRLLHQKKRGKNRRGFQAEPERDNN